MLKDEVKKPIAEKMLVERNGACKFCGQMAVMKVPKIWEDEVVDEYATEMCKCSDAQVYTSRKQRLEKAEDIIDKTFSKANMTITETAVLTLKKACACMIQHEFEAIQIKCGEVTANISENSDGKITITGSRKEKYDGSV